MASEPLTSRAATPQEEAITDLREATTGFDHVFANELDKAREVFEARETPIHLLGLGALSFLEAALGMESGLMVEATRLLTLAEANARKQVKVAKALKPTGRFPAATEWELVHADATILLGMTHALSESYMGYLQCL
ncbi:hypothetical protein OF83DRAFT_1175762 [Amylostereum chailletii]|nr:hypothetical protein OF83DRAFT_1175762 [Amylostereum chailletii]